MEGTSLRVRIRAHAHRGFARRARERFFPRLGEIVRWRICRAGASPATRRAASGALALQSLKAFVLFVAFVFWPNGACLADIPWPEVKRRVAAENEKLSKRPGGHAGTYFVVCTVYYTPKESGFTADRGFDVTPV